MLYSEYKLSRDLAWEVLINESVTELPVSVSHICKNMGIAIKLYEPTDGSSGESTIIDGNPIIFVNQSDLPERQRFTAAHELGHILLGHVGKYKLVNREPSNNDNTIERAANVFASRLLAPACVLWGCGCKTAEEISRLCCISNQAAQFRAERMQILYERNAFLKSPLEQKVYANFMQYIQQNKL